MGIETRTCAILRQCHIVAQRRHDSHASEDGCTLEDVHSELSLLRIFRHLEGSEKGTEYLLGAKRASLRVIDLSCEPFGEDGTEAVRRDAEVLCRSTVVLDHIVQLDELRVGDGQAR